MAVVVAVATPALAYHPVLSGQVRCAENGQQVITWTLSHVVVEQRPMQIQAIELSRGDLTGFSVGQTIPAPPAPGSTVTGTSVYPGDATGSVVLTVIGEWGVPQEDIADERATATVELVGTCVAPTTTTTSTTTTSSTTTSSTTSTTSTSTTSTSTTTTTTIPATTTTTIASQQTQVGGVLIERTPSPAAAPAAVAPAAVAAAPASVAAAPAELPRTGTGTAVLSGLAIVLIGLGSLFVRASRPRSGLLTTV